MKNLGFATPINFQGEKGCFEQIFQASEDYFAFGYYRAFPIPNKISQGSQEVEIHYSPDKSTTEWCIKTALKVASYVTIILPLIMITLKLLFRSLCHFHYIPTSELIKKGIDIPPSTIEKIEAIVEKVIKKEAIEGVRYYDSQDNHRVFSLEDIPDLIFKMKANLHIASITDDNDTMEGRFKSLCRARTVCRTHQLGLLVVPNAKLFKVEHNGEKHTLLAERKLNVIADGSGQEELFEKLGCCLDAAIRQLATFICITGYSDVEWRNNPIINDSQDETGNYKIGLVDVEELRDVKNGLFGGKYRRGLINCVNQLQGKIALEEAKRHFTFWSGQYDTLAEKSLQRRKKEIAENSRIRRFHEDHGIVEGDEPIQWGWFELDFPGYLEGNALKNLAKTLVEKINKKIAKRSSEMSTKRRRYIWVDTVHPGSAFYQMDQQYPNATKQGSEDSYLEIALKRLVELGYLYKITRKSGQGYYLQA